METTIQKSVLNHYKVWLHTGFFDTRKYNDTHAAWIDDCQTPFRNIAFAMEAFQICIARIYFALNDKIQTHRRFAINAYPLLIKAITTDSHMSILMLAYI